jgi:hypothetical protein
LTGCQPNDYGQKYRVENFEVFYGSTVDISKVKELHQYFVSHDLINDNKQSIQITKSKDKVILKLVQSKGATNMTLLPEYREALRNIAKEISEDIFDGAYCELHLASNTFKTLEIIA